MSKLNYNERAAKLGHSFAQLSAGNEIVTTLHVHSLDEIRVLVDEFSGANRDLLANNTKASSVPNPDILSRVQDYIYGGIPLSQGDMNIIKPAFPLNIRAVSAENKVYNAETEIGNNDMFAVYNYGTVTFQDKACVNVTYTELLYTVDKIIRQGTPATGKGDFNILGKKGSSGSKGSDGDAGGNGGNGSPGNCSSAGISGDSGGPGGNGATGQNGLSGQKGGDGIESKKATITITSELTSANGKFYIVSQSGQGGNGGDGGKGGKGGNGGNGGNGANCGCTGSSGGNAGNGGTGGNGGNGGDGGNGKDSNETITVILPAAYAHMIYPILKDVDGGTAGDAGDKGLGGDAGYRGDAGKHNDAGGSGSAGGNGSAGYRGKNGEKGKPAKIEVQNL